MARLIKILAGIFGALILLLVLAALLLPLLFDQDDLKQAIGEVVLENPVQVDYWQRYGWSEMCRVSVDGISCT